MSLGEGGQGSVSLVAYRADARLYALKAIKKRTENAHRRSENAWVFQEQDIMRRLARRVSGCPFFVELLASFEDERNLYLVTDAYEGGDLQDAIYTSDLKKLTVGEARPIAAQIILGMQALHGLRIIHRDIKPANIFLDKQDNVRIGDFGLACAFGRTYAEQPWLGKPHGYYLLEPERTEAEQDGDPREDTATRQCGTREYMAPEMCRGDPYSYEVDVWAFGMVVYEMLHGKILDKDARNRPSWEQIQAHPWFDGL
ncbi:kinase-like domain-containing protein [Trametes meyenii]|nr:kinase-like domain-containing protein [Trametes meyenii]